MNNVVKIEELDMAKGLKRALTEIGPKAGWNLQIDESIVAVGVITLEDGRTAEVQVVIVTDEDDFLSEYDEDL